MNKETFKTLYSNYRLHQRLESDRDFPEEALLLRVHRASQYIDRKPGYWTREQLQGRILQVKVLDHFYQLLYSGQ